MLKTFAAEIAAFIEHCIVCLSRCPLMPLERKAIRVTTTGVPRLAGHRATADVYRAPRAR